MNAGNVSRLPPVSPVGSTKLSLYGLHQVHFRSIIQDDGRGKRGAMAIIRDSGKEQRDMSEIVITRN